MDGCRCGWMDEDADGWMLTWKDGGGWTDGCGFGCGQMDADADG